MNKKRNVAVEISPDMNRTLEARNRYSKERKNGAR